MNTTQTKKRILEAASLLFAKKGYDGASIRDIANEADVNIAAVNYHFKNKQTLYWAVTMDSQAWLENAIEKMSKEHDSAVDLSLAVFKFLEEHGSHLRNAFMMFLSDSIPEIDESMVGELKNEELGPPGMKYLLEKINAELGADVPYEAQRWAAKNIFSCIFHWALMMETSHCKEIYKDHPDFQPEVIYKKMVHNVRAALLYAKEKGGDWDY